MSNTVAGIIKGQIETGVFMSLGASDFYALPNMAGSDIEGRNYNRGGLRFTARILPFTKAGKRSTKPRAMFVWVVLNGSDLYDVTVKYFDKSRGDVEFFTAGNVYADQINRVLLSLDYDGQTVTNPRYWEGE